MLQRAMERLSNDSRARLVEDCAAAIEAEGWPTENTVARIASIARTNRTTVEKASNLELRALLSTTLFAVPPLIAAELLRPIFMGRRVAILESLYDAIGVRRDAEGDVSDSEFERTADESIFLPAVDRLARAGNTEELPLLLEVIAAVGAAPWRRVAQIAAARLHAGDAADSTAERTKESPDAPPKSGPESGPESAHVSEVLQEMGMAAELPTELAGELAGESMIESDSRPVDGPSVAFPAIAEAQPTRATRQSSGATRTAFGPAAFSPLDRLLLQTIVGVFDEVPGTPEVKAIEDAVDELQRLNSARHRSAFHGGFLDAMLQRSVRVRQMGDVDERRAWYLAGRLYASGRLLGAGQRSYASVERTNEPLVAAIAALPAEDREFLVHCRSEAGAELAPAVVPRLLDAGQIDDAFQWLRTHGGTGLRLPTDVLTWVEGHLLDGDAETCGRLVRLCRESLQDPNPPVEEADGDRAIAMRRDRTERGRLMARTLALEGLIRRLQRNFVAAVRCYEAAIEQHERLEQDAFDEIDAIDAGVDPLTRSIEISAEAAAAAGGLALAWLSIGDLAEIRVRPQGDGQSQRDAIAGVTSLLERAASSRDPWPPALVIQAMPVVLDRQADERQLDTAIRALQRAAALMSESERPIWNHSGLLVRCRLYLAVAVLRRLDPSTADPAAERVADLLRQDVDAPDEMWRMALEDASAAGVPAAIEIATALFERDPVGTIRSADLPRLTADPRFRRHLQQWLTEDQSGMLTPTERANLLEQMLRGAIRPEARDAEVAEWAIGELDAMAMIDSVAEVHLLRLLEDRSLWEGAIDERDCIDIRVRHLDRLGRSSELGELLLKQLHQAISSEEPALARDLFEWLHELGLDEMATGVERRLDAMESEQRVRRESAPRNQTPITIGFVGGNETQRQYEDELRRRLSRRVPKLKVWFEFPGWGSNWGAVADRIERSLPETDAIVLMPMVRTELGRRVRRLSSETNTPWIACTGRGCESVARSLFHAVDVVHRQHAVAEHARHDSSGDRS